MEVIELEHYCVQQHLVPKYVHQNIKRHNVFHLFISRKIKQDDANTGAYRKHIIELLQ